MIADTLQRYREVFFVVSTEVSKLDEALEAQLGPRVGDPGAKHAENYKAKRKEENETYEEIR